jgi:hypothetical protein
MAEISSFTTDTIGAVLVLGINAEAGTDTDGAEPPPQAVKRSDVATPTKNKFLI